MEHPSKPAKPLFFPILEEYLDKLFANFAHSISFFLGGAEIAMVVALLIGVIELRIDIIRRLVIFPIVILIFKKTASIKSTE